MRIKNSEKKILVLDDDEDDFRIISDYILAISNNEFLVDWSYKYDDGLAKLHRREYDLYLVDYRLGAKTGVDFLKDANSYGRDEPIILLTGKGNYDLDVLSMHLGAADYLVKTELSTEKLERSIRYAIGRASTLKEIRAKEAKYRNLFENSKDVIFVVDPSLRILEINSAVRDFLGYNLQEVLSGELNTILGIASENGVNNIRPGVEYDDLELEVLNRDGEIRYCTLTLNNEIKDASGGNMQGILHDITNLKLIEKSKIQTEKLAASGRLLRTIAHEVRNPINNIALAATQLQYEVSGEPASDYLQIIQRNSQRINGLITELLNTSRPASGQLKKNILRDIVQEVIATAKDRILLLHIRLEEKMPTAPGFVLADAGSLKLALQNIVMNAIEAINHDHGKLEVCLEDEESQIVLCITDNGCGIASEDLARLFEPFFTQKKNGLGLGLTYSMNILRAHDVVTDVRSVPGAGTTFRLTFPKVDY